MSMLQEFKEFMRRGNMIDLAVGVVMGTAFGTIVGSLVKDMIMPPLGLLIGGVDFSNFFLALKGGEAGFATLADAQKAGAVTLNYGLFINTIINFLIIGLAIFLLIKQMNRLMQKPKPAPAPVATSKECPFCFSSIALKAIRCPHCTSELKSDK